MSILSGVAKIIAAKRMAAGTIAVESSALIVLIIVFTHQILYSY
tara:strand:+ start:2647 stop:2778 length:132 start_codon:yes stop_codon:yes gene_type:complete